MKSEYNMNDGGSVARCQIVSETHPDMPPYTNTPPKINAPRPSARRAQLTPGPSARSAQLAHLPELNMTGQVHVILAGSSATPNILAELN